MARISRKNLQLGVIPTFCEKKYLTAIYARLSIEDNGVGGDSIHNQIYLIEKYISKQPQLQYVDAFVDNGMTGVNFNRPEFQRLMEATKKGGINCIVVKDLSRFGRNYIETGEYLEKIFPFLGVRFISVNDNYDSLDENGNNSLIVSLKGILHDTYAKDISKKVSTAIDVKKKSGKFMGKIPPFGYIRCMEDRYKLTVHRQRASVIKDIFNWRLEGLGATTIAHKLNDLEVPSQLKLRFIEGYSDGKENALWHGSAVKDILTNPCYTGCIVERKSNNSLYKVKPVKAIPHAQLNLIKNTHEAIIDEETFYKVQKTLAESALERKHSFKKYPQRRRSENILGGLLVCGVCGGKMQRNGGYYKLDGTLVNHFFYCNRKYIKKGVCNIEAVSEKKLIDVVFEICKKQIALLADVKAIIEDYLYGNKEVDKKEQLGKEIKILNTVLFKLKNKGNYLYASFKEDVLLKEEYQATTSKYKKEIERVNSKLMLCKTKLKLAENEPAISGDFIEGILKFETKESLTREMCLCLIEKIVVRGNGLSIFFTFKAEYEQAVLFIKNLVEGGQGNE